MIGEAILWPQHLLLLEKKNKMINLNGWEDYNIWSHSKEVFELYKNRSMGNEDEMTCAAQAAEIMKLYVKKNEVLLDVGCGTGYFYHSILSRKLPLNYFGLDATKKFIDCGQKELKKFGLNKDKLIFGRIEDLKASVDHILCMNVLSNIDNFQKPLERILKSAKKSVVIRESLSDKANYLYVTDKYLDFNKKLKVYVNTYNQFEVIDFIKSYGFDVHEEIDIRTNNEAELVIDYPHYWKFLIAKKR